ncbi:E1-E2 ATPase-domain-containing protein [Mycena crocata]|nr:E1-E2 ATPase-domain-containing protein [Mycena crocata]
MRTLKSNALENPSSSLPAPPNDPMDQCRAIPSPSSGNSLISEDVNALNQGGSDGTMGEEACGKSSAIIDEESDCDCCAIDDDKKDDASVMDGESHCGDCCRGGDDSEEDRESNCGDCCGGDDIKEDDADACDCCATETRPQDKTCGTPPCVNDCCRKDEDEGAYGKLDPAQPLRVSAAACEQGCCSSTDEDMNEKAFEEDNDDSLCPCCIEILVQHPEAIGRTLTEAESADPALFPKNSAHQMSSAIRKCCRLFEAFCAQKPCCFQLAPRQIKAPVPSFPSKCKQPAEPIPVIHASDNLANSFSDKSNRQPLQIEITGMDCADCCIKVSRALSSLPSVKQVHIGYIEAVGTCLYDPEVITPEAIARYVARATGFTIKAIAEGDARPSTHVTLPVTFNRSPPAYILEQLNARHRKNGFTEISFPIRGDGARQPRQVLAELAPYSPVLLPADAPGRTNDRVSKDLRRIALRTLCIILLAIPVLIIAWAPLPGSSFTHGLVSVILTTLIQAVAFPILSSSVRFIIFMHAVDMSVLVSVSSLSAWIFSLVSFALETAGKPFAEPFFETVALLLALVHVGRLVQAATRRATSSALRELQQLQPSDIILVEQVGTSRMETLLDARLLYYGDIVRLGPASRIPTDGMVVAGSSAVDESFVTGESLPRVKQVGNSVTAGTLNLDGPLDIQITQLIHENYLVRIASLVRKAQATRSRFHDLADQFSAMVLPISVACSAIAFLIWFLVNKYGRHLQSTPSAVGGLTYALAILIVSCPCAIGVAVPFIVAAALRAGLREGVLFRSSEALHMAHNVDVVVFDKTGTLSHGVFSLERKEILVNDADRVIHPLISTNEHPISKAVLAHVENVDRPFDPRAPSKGITSLPGMGIKAMLAGYPLLGGSPKFTGTMQHPFVQEFTARGLTLFTVTLGGQLVAAFGLADTPRADAAALLEVLAARGKHVVILSGDNSGAVARFVAMLPIQLGDAQAACTPAGKAEFIKALQARGQRVCFVGDGTNDAPALAQADVALCVAAGADVAVAAAGALVAGENLKRGVLAALDVAKHAQQHMMVALWWCVLYNAVALLFAGGLFVKVRIEPQWAGLGELVSLLPVLVVGIALDLRWKWRRQ